jgi:hypothetical protein
MVSDAPIKFRPDLHLTSVLDAVGVVQPASIPSTEATLITENLPYEESDIPPHLEIVTADGEIVTVIEVLSPANKAGEYNTYLNKRYRMLKAGINLVEVDLLRDGQRVPLGTEIETPYVCLVNRAEEWPKTHVWGITWGETCPVLPVPLCPDEPDVRL